MSEQVDCPTQSSHPSTPVESTPTLASTPTPSSTPTSTSTNLSPRKRKLTSVVWNDFKKVKIDGVDYATCNFCKAKLKAHSKNGTTHLHEHLKRCRKNHNMDIRQQLLQGQHKRNDGNVEYRPFFFDQNVTRNDMANMIIIHEYPLSMVNHFGFRKFVSNLQPCFKMVSRNTIKSDIFKIYNSKKEKTYKFFEKLDSRVAITTDMWTCNHTKKGFMAITTHYITDTWFLDSRILKFVYVPIPHNKEVLSGVLIDTFMEWNIDRKISTITVDNCTTNDAIIDIILEKLPLDTLLLGGKVLHMRCCAHILNLIVKDGLEVIGRQIERIRDSVLYWTATQGRIENFEEAARQLRIPCTKKMSLDCKTRWNSTYLMLQNALAYKDVFPRVKQRERHYTSLPTEADWNLAKEICGKLKLFYNVTEFFSGTNYPTANLYFPKICEIKVALCQWIESPNETIMLMATKMLEKYKKYWSGCHVIMGIACVLDPRYKMKLIEYYYKAIYENDYRVEFERILQDCYELLREYQLNTRSNENNPDSASFDHSDSTPIDIDDHDPLNDYDLFVSSTISNVHIKSELDFYLEENVLPRTPDFDVLSWWKTNGVKFPTLQRIARDILAIPISTVASESAFSTSGRVVGPSRNRLHAKTLEALMCSQSWLSSEVNVSCANATVCDDDDDDDESI